MPVRTTARGDCSRSLCATAMPSSSSSRFMALAGGRSNVTSAMPSRSSMFKEAIRWPTLERISERGVVAHAKLAHLRHIRERADAGEASEAFDLDTVVLGDRAEDQGIAVELGLRECGHHAARHLGEHGGLSASAE